MTTRVTINPEESDYDAVDIFLITPSKATIPDGIAGRCPGQRFSHAYGLMTNSGTLNANRMEAVLCLVLPKRGALNEVAKSMHLWKEIHILLETSTLTPGDDIPSMVAGSLPFPTLVRTDALLSCKYACRPRRDANGLDTRRRSLSNISHVNSILSYILDLV